MPDPYRRVQAGEDVEFSAALWNAMGDAAKDRKAHELDRTAEAGARARSGEIVRVRNDSGRNLDRGAVLGLAGPVFPPSAGAMALQAFLREVAFKGVVPAGTHHGKFGVTLDPVRAGGVGRAYVSGVAAVRLNVLDPTHKCADVTSGETGMLSTAKDGTAQVLWRESDDTAYGHDTGAMWAIVRLGTTCAGGSGSGPQARCDCPLDTYEVDVNCGLCGPYYDGPMPKFWNLEIKQAAGPYDFDTCYSDGGSTICRLGIQNYQLKHHEPDPYSGNQDPCIWDGKGRHCIDVELTVAGNFWQITLMDRFDCVLAILRKPISDFACCGPNSGWDQVAGSCHYTAILVPDPCTCCHAPGPPNCPPEDGPRICPEKCCDGPCTLDTTWNVICAAVVCPTDPETGLPVEGCVPVPTCTSAGHITMNWIRGCTWHAHEMGVLDGVPYDREAMWDGIGGVLTIRVLVGDHYCSFTFHSEPAWDCHTANLVWDPNCIGTGTASLSAVPYD